MQTVKNAALTLAHFVWKVLLVEIALLIIVAILWFLTTWHITASYGFSLFTVGGIMVGIGLIGLVGRGGSRDTKLMEAEVEMRSWDHKGKRRFISSYTESTRLIRWLLGLGFITAVTGTVFNMLFT